MRKLALAILMCSIWGGAAAETETVEGLEAREMDGGAKSEVAPESAIVEAQPARTRVGYVIADDKVAEKQPQKTSDSPKVKAATVTVPRAKAPASGAIELNLPGVGTMPGSAPELDDNVIRVTSNRTHLVNVSATMTNRIATPFETPKAIVAEDVATVERVGQSLYVATTSEPGPIALYVTGANANDPVVSLTLIPKSMPPQTIVLQLDGIQGSTDSGASRRDDARSGAYSERIVAVFRSMALGKIPQGFTQGLLPKASVSLGGITAYPISRYSGPGYDAFRYRIETASPEAMEMEESAFWSKGVRAVAFFPSAVVAKGRPTEVFVLSDKTATSVGSRQ